MTRFEAFMNKEIETETNKDVIKGLQRALLLYKTQIDIFQREIDEEDEDDWK